MRISTEWFRLESRGDPKKQAIKGDKTVIITGLNDLLLRISDPRKMQRSEPKKKDFVRTLSRSFPHVCFYIAVRRFSGHDGVMGGFEFEEAVLLHVFFVDPLFDRL